MKILNSKTRRDITLDYLGYIQGKITQEEFALIASIPLTEDISKYLPKI